VSRPLRPTDAIPPPSSRRRLLRPVRWAVGLATAAVIVRVAIDQADDLRRIQLTVQPLWLAPAAASTVAAGLVLPLAWRHLLAAYGWPLPRARAVRVWCLSQATRYLPTGLVAVASRLSLTAAEGVPRSVAAASLALETVLLLGWASLMGALFIPSSVVPLPLRLMLGVGAAVGIATLPWTLRGIGARLVRVPPLGPSTLRRRQLLEGIALFGLNTVLRAGRFLALAAALLPVTAGDLPLLVGAAYAGVVAGMVGITPAGIGVREGVIAAVLATRYPLGDAAALAVLLRAWDFAFEVAFLGVVSWFGRRR
jgi:glycosyltransferase 2 family protein